MSHEITCKCGAATLAGHVAKIEAGYPAHTFGGLFSDWVTPTDAELAAAIEANSRSASMIQLDCGDIDIVESHEVRENDWTECPDGCGQVLVTDVTRTAIVETIHA